MIMLIILIGSIAISQTYDESFPEQWGHENTEDNIGTLDCDIDVEMAWSISRGNGVTIAIIDNGIDIEHPEFAGRILQGYNFIYANDDDDNTDYTDTSPIPQGSVCNYPTSHGTNVAGIAVAARNNLKADGSGYEGIAGVACEANILPVVICPG